MKLKKHKIHWGTIAGKMEYIAQLPGVRAAAPAEWRQRRQRRAGGLRGVRERRRRRRCAGAPSGRAAPQLGRRHSPRIREAWQGGSQWMDSRTRSMHAHFCVCF